MYSISEWIICVHLRKTVGTIDSSSRMWTSVCVDHNLSMPKFIEYV